MNPSDPSAAARPGVTRHPLDHYSQILCHIARDDRYAHSGLEVCKKGSPYYLPPKPDFYPPRDDPQLYFYAYDFLRDVKRNVSEPQCQRFKDALDAHGGKETLNQTFRAVEAIFRAGGQGKLWREFMDRFMLHRQAQRPRVVFF
ncbi:MAG: hypothetical protein Q9222_002241 [Ikaeria aurantiellina]